MSGLDSVVVENCLKFASVFGSGLIAGNGLYVSLVAHPAILAMPTMEIAARAWYEIFKRTKDLQIKLTIVTTIGTFGTYGLNKYRGSPVSLAWPLSGLILQAMLPYTIIFLVPINKMLWEHDVVVKEKGDKWTKQAIESWGKRHAFRTVSALVSFGMLCYTLCV